MLPTEENLSLYTSLHLVMITVNVVLCEILKYSITLLINNSVNVLKQCVTLNYLVFILTQHYTLEH